MVINGFSVVTLPEYNNTIDSETNLFRRPPSMNGILYKGFHRKVFGGIHDLYLNDALPDDIKKFFLKVRQFRNSGLYNYYVTDSYEEAIIMKKYLKSLGDNLEVIGLCSKEIEKYLGCNEFEGNVDFLGFDVDTDGYSAVLTCFFEKTYLFQDYMICLNGNGLIVSELAAWQIVEKYLEIQFEFGLEEIDRSEVDVVAIYRPTDQ